MSFQTINPATGETLRTFPMASDAEVATALTTADDRYNSDWKLRTVAARAQIVKRAAILLRQNADEYAGYMTLEMGKLAAEARGEVELSAAILEYYADRAEEFLKPQPLAEAPGSVVVIEPIGVLVADRALEFPLLPARPSGRLAAGRGQRRHLQTCAARTSHSAAGWHSELVSRPARNPRVTPQGGDVAARLICARRGACAPTLVLATNCANAAIPTNEGSNANLRLLCCCRATDAGPKSRNRTKHHRHPS